MSEEHAADQRKGFRCPVLDEQQEAELLVGQSWTAVRIRDESAGGFAVLTTICPAAECGQTLQLRNSSGCFEVRLAHLTESEPADGEQEPTFCLGLERLREVADRPARKPRRAGWFLWPFLARPAPSSTMLVTGLVVAVLVIGLPTGMILLLWRSDHPASNRAVSWGKRALSHFQPSSSWKPKPAEESEKPWLSKWSAKLSQPLNAKDVERSWDSPQAASASSRAAQAAGDSATSALESLRATVGRLPGGTAMVFPEVAAYLSLSEAQHREVRHIMEKTLSALEELERQQQQTEQQRLESRRLLLEAARRQALELLSEQQRARWATLAGPEENAAAPAPP